MSAIISDCDVQNLWRNKMIEKKVDNYISLEDAAEYLDIKPVTLRKWIRNKKDLPAHQIGKLWKFKRSELDEWVNSGKSSKNAT